MANTVSPLARYFLRFILSLYKRFILTFRRIQNFVLSARGVAPTPAEQRIHTGQAWDEFCDTLKAAGATVLAPGAPTDPFNQAEGYRYLSRLARAGLENFVECADVECPRLCAIVNGGRAARICIGSDNPDNLYENATLDSSNDYIVTGKRGTVPYLSFGTQSGSYGSRGGLATVDLMEANQLIYDGGEGAQRTFTILLSAERPAEGKGTLNWLRLEREPREALFIVRQTFGDRSNETPALLTIRRRGSALTTSGTYPTPLTPAQLDSGLQRASLLVAGASALFAKWSYDFQSHTNKLPLRDRARSTSAGGDPNIRYYHSYWRLTLGEVLRIRVQPPKKLCRSWNFQLNNHWMESLDYRYHTVHTNSTLARPDPNLLAEEEEDQSYTILVSHIDPNSEGSFRGNWIETVGHDCGTMCFRYVGVGVEVPDGELPEPVVDVVPLGEL